MAYDATIIRAQDGMNNSISGVVKSAMVKWFLVFPSRTALAGKPGATDDAAELLAASNEIPLVLERETINATQIPLDLITFKDTLETPNLINHQATARKVQWYEVEGPELLDAATMISSVALDAPVKVVAGILLPAASGNTIVGYVRGKLAPKLSTNSVRFLIEFAGTKTIMP